VFLSFDDSPRAAPEEQGRAYRALYYRLTGQPFNSVPRPAPRGPDIERNGKRMGLGYGTQVAE
jgi:hypothetical protein